MRPGRCGPFAVMLHITGCRVSEALALTPERVDLAGRAVVLETLKKRRQGVFRAVPVPPGLLDQLDLVHGLREAQRRGKGHSDRPLWPWSRNDRLAPGQGRHGGRGQPRPPHRTPKGLQQETMSARTACGLPARHRRS